SIAVKDKVTIGDNTLFGENVKIYDHNHRFNKINIPIEKQGYSVKAVTIGKHCWIGSNVVILKGVTIGDNCIIGAGCVVSENVPENTILKLGTNNLIRTKIIPY
ncbi:acyltransferase, partial [Lactobacillus crispatus]|uniref:acyltransferase n=1 Tax=Lactobacillus crispatus TaxID=47770 RepID=UPI001179A8D7